RDVKVALTQGWGKGGEGGIELAKQVKEALETPNNFKQLYDLDLSIPEKIEKIDTEVYGGEGVKFNDKENSQIKAIEENGWGDFPVCMAKTQYSLSDDEKKLGRPTGFTITVRELIAKTGAGFIVALTGNVMTMPGL